MSKQLLYVILFILVVSSGCVTQDKFDGLSDNYNKLQNENSDLEHQNEGLNNQVTVLQTNLETLQSNVDSLESEKTSLNSQVSSLQSQVATLETQVTGITDAEASLDSAKKKLDALNLFNTKFGPGLTTSEIGDISSAMNAAGGTSSDIWNTLLGTNCDAGGCNTLIVDLQTALDTGIKADIDSASSALGT